jgi:hypothetical protein
LHISDVADSGSDGSKEWNTASAKDRHSLLGVTLCMQKLQGNFCITSHDIEYTSTSQESRKLVDTEKLEAA